MVLVAPLACLGAICVGRDERGALVLKVNWPLNPLTSGRQAGLTAGGLAWAVSNVVGLQ
jgi:hypothetical protein